MIPYFIQALGILAVFWILYELLLKHLTFFAANRFFLIGGLLSSVLVPLFPLNFSPETTQYINVSSDYLNAATSPEKQITSAFVWQELLPNTFMDWLTVAYFFGVFVFLVRLILQFLWVIRLIQQGELERQAGVRVVFTSQKVSPFSFFNTIVVNPNDVRPKQWKDVFTHEKIHIKDKHQFDLVITELLRCLFWFYPIFYIYANRLKLNLEYLTDSRSISHGLDRTNYQLSLVQLSLQAKSPLIGNSFSKKILKNRIKMIHKMKSKNQLRYLYAACMPALLLTVFFLSVVVQSQEKRIKKVIVITEENTPIEDIQIKVKDEKGKMQDLSKTQIEMVNPDEKNKTITVEEIEEIDNTTGQKTTKTVTTKKYTAYEPVNNFRFKINEGGMIVYDSLKVSLGDSLHFYSRKPIVYGSFNLEDDCDLDIREIQFNRKGLTFRISDPEKNLLTIEERDLIEKTRSKAIVRGTWDDKEKAPTIYIDGKKVTQEKLDSFEVDQIESVTVLRGKASNSPNGEIHVKTKENEAIE